MIGKQLIRIMIWALVTRMIESTKIWNFDHVISVMLGKIQLHIRNQQAMLAFDIKH